MARSDSSGGGVEGRTPSTVLSLDGELTVMLPRGVWSKGLEVAPQTQCLPHLREGCGRPAWQARGRVPEGRPSPPALH